MARQPITYNIAAKVLGVKWQTARDWGHAQADFTSWESLFASLSGIEPELLGLNPTEEGWHVLVAALGRQKAVELVGHSDGLSDDEVDETVDSSDPDDEGEESRWEGLCGDSPESMMKRVLYLELRVFRRLKGNSDPKTVSAYSALAKLRLELEEKAAEQRRVEQSLIPLELVVAAAQTVVTTVLSEIRALPDAAAHRVNPQDPSAAKIVLEQVVDQLVKSANRQCDAQLSEILNAPLK